MLTGAQAEGAMPIINAFKNTANNFIPETNPGTIATSIRIGNSVVEKNIYSNIQTGGYSVSVTDDEILVAQKLLGRKEEIDVEPASAASIAGAKEFREGVIDSDENVVRICTGNMLKDPDTIIKSYDPPIKCDNKIESVEKTLF